jgi:hypothetical protein
MDLRCEGVYRPICATRPTTMLVSVQSSLETSESVLITSASRIFSEPGFEMTVYSSAIGQGVVTKERNGYTSSFEASSRISNSLMYGGILRIRDVSPRIFPVPTVPHERRTTW